MNYAALLTDQNVVTFFLLFIRWSALLAFLPVFNYTTIPMNIKVAFAMWFTFITFPLVPLVQFPITTDRVILAVLNEVTFGFFTGIALQMVFMILQFAGQLVAFVMGLTMANIVDPSTGMQTPVTSQIFNIIALTVFLAADGHHLMLLLVAKSLHSMPFGEFFDMQHMGDYLFAEMKKFFTLGLSLAFPILSISLLSDIIFGMIMKSMPQFNLLVIGFPIKIGLSIAVLITILSSMMFMFKKEILHTIQVLSSFI
ncbi:MAG: flagellar type III secretion system protein FliR [Epsilonproteobacteria bacterium]|nr:flagellar type III secretion system protein FliR [Campylobacterota bacterium]